MSGGRKRIRKSIQSLAWQIMRYARHVSACFMSYKLITPGGQDWKTMDMFRIYSMRRVQLCTVVGSIGLHCGFV